jgi:hypothetical protein
LVFEGPKPPKNKEKKAAATPKAIAAPKGKKSK